MDDRERIGEGNGRVNLINALWMLLIAVPIFGLVGLALLAIYFASQPLPTF